MEVTPLAPSLGAEIRGVALASASQAEIERIQALLLEHLVLFFPEQHLSIDEHVAFARHFGPLEAHPNLDSPECVVPEIFELMATHGGVADEWHSDITFRAEPSIFAILNMVRCPTVGGDTMWANAYKAYEDLSPPMRELCDGLTALHDAHPHGHPDQMAIHPVVRRHPVTNRRSLFVNEHFTRRIVEMSHEESEMLLRHLTRWVTHPRFTVRYRWTKGTIAIWDNRCTQHFVLNDFDDERVIQRATVMGDQPEPACPPRWPAWVSGGFTGAMGRHDRQLNRQLRRQVRDLESNARQD